MTSWRGLVVRRLPVLVEAPVARGYRMVASGVVGHWGCRTHQRLSESRIAYAPIVLWRRRQLTQSVPAFVIQ